MRVGGGKRRNSLDIQEGREWGDEGRKSIDYISKGSDCLYRVRKVGPRDGCREETKNLL